MKMPKLRFGSMFISESPQGPIFAVISHKINSGPMETPERNPGDIYTYGPTRVSENNPAVAEVTGQLDSFTLGSPLEVNRKLIKGIQADQTLPTNLKELALSMLQQCSKPTLEIWTQSKLFKLNYQQGQWVDRVSGNSLATLDQEARLGNLTLNKCSYHVN